MSKKVGKVIIISGPSGVGKGTLLKRVFAESGLPLVMSVSATTRKPRPGEKDGVHYRFLDAANFENRKNNGEFLECFEVFATGTWYGTLKSDVENVLANGEWAVLEIDVQGAFAVKKIYPDALTVFVEPKSVEVLKERLRGRGTENEEAMNRRLETALKELEYAGQFQFSVINDDLETAVKELTEILKSN